MTGKLLRNGGKIPLSGRNKLPIMTTVESKTGTICANEEVIYNFLTDFTNFDSLIPADKVENWESTRDSCSFTIKEAGHITINMIEKTPFNYIKISPAGKIPFIFNIYLKIFKIPI